MKNDAPVLGYVIEREDAMFMAVGLWDSDLHRATVFGHYSEASNALSGPNSRFPARVIKGCRIVAVDVDGDGRPVARDE